MQTKTCNSCGKDYPATNTHCHECFTTLKEATKYEQENCSHSKYKLVQDSFSKQQYHRECINCGKKAKCTKYKIN